MKQITLFILSGLLVFGSCRKRVDEPYHSPREEHSAYQQNMRIDTFSTVNGLRFGVAANGDMKVFSYRNSWGVSDDIYDNEYSATIWFQVSPELTTFTYSDSQLTEKRCFFTGSGAWGGYGFEALDKGVISGTKNADGSWEISIDVILKGVDQRLQTNHIVKKGTFQEGKF